MQTILQNRTRIQQQVAPANETAADMTNAGVTETDPPGAVGSADRLSHARARARARGQSLFEYSMIILFVILVVVAAIALIAPALNGIFNQVPGLF